MPGWNVPLWCARLRSDEDEEVEPHDDDIFEIDWWGCFSYGLLRDSMDHAWKPICCGHETIVNGFYETKKYHAFGSWSTCKCSDGSPAKDHGPCNNLPASTLLPPPWFPPLQSSTLLAPPLLACRKTITVALIVPHQCSISH